MKHLFTLLIVAFIQTLNATPYKLAIASVFKDEAPYLKEWIEYHKLMGAEHFRLYNNNSTDDYLAVLAPYIEKGEVSLVEWPSTTEDLKSWVVKTQWRACVDAVNYYNGKSHWLAFLDIDEYLFPLEAPDMITFLEDYEEYPGVVLNWQCYGTSFVQEIPPGNLIIETFTLRAEDYSEQNYAVKSIVKPHCVDVTKYPWAPHSFSFLTDKPAVFPDLHEWPKNHSSTWICPEKAVINHYVHRSEAYFWKTKIAKKLRMENIESLDPEYIQVWRESCNQVEDKRMLRFLPSLKKRMEQ